MADAAAAGGEQDGGREAASPDAGRRHAGTITVLRTVSGVPIDILDHAGLLYARTRGHTPAAERAVAGFSKLAEHGLGWIAVGLAGALLDRDQARRREWLRGAGTVAAAYGANQALKFTIRRRRPELPGLPQLTDTVSQLSFPSAHATTSFAAARAFSRLAPAGVLYAVAAAIGASRPYLGVHYPSDVLAGAVLGTAVAEVRGR
jgi:membrane-associated phospholipid phosphatase